MCLADAVRLRENLNVLVPNNDVNLHAEIKKLLNGDEVDPKDLSDNEIESLNGIRSHKVNKLFNKSSKKTVSKDGENDDVAENQTERDLNRLNAASLNQNQTTYGNTTFNATTPSNFSTTPNEWETASTRSWNDTPTYPSTSSNGNPTTPQWTTPNFNDTTYPATNVSTTFTPTAAVNGTETTRNVTTSLASTPTIPIYNTTTVGTTPHSSSIPSAVTEQATEMTTSTTSETIYDDLQPDECLLGKAERRLEWVDSQGKLLTNFIISKHGYVNFKDLSRSFNGSSQLENFVLINLQNLTVSIHKQSKTGEKTFYQKCFHFKSRSYQLILSALS